MISNPKLKKIFQTYVFGVVSIINKRIRHDKRKIILYSNMGFRDNVKSLYDYLIEQKYNEQYEIICCCNDFKRWSFVNIPNVKFVSCVKGFFYYFFAGYVFYSFGKIPIVPGINQKTIQLWHGNPYKAADAGMLKGHSWKHQYYSFSVATSRTFAKIWSRYFSMPLDHVLIGGQPRNDILYKSWPEYDFGDYKKLVLWAPTFRYSSKMGYQDVEDAKIVPILHSEDFIKINDYLKEKGVKIVVKLHPVQDLDKYDMMEMSNFILLSHAEFVKRGMDLYKFMTQCDALITDYSSIFYDYLLLDRPIAFTEDDLEDYSDVRGFAVDDPQGYKPGYRIRNLKNLYEFIDCLLTNTDFYKEERKRVNELVNEYRDGNFCQHILDLVGIIK